MSLLLIAESVKCSRCQFFGDGFQNFTGFHLLMIFSLDWFTFSAYSFSKFNCTEKA